ncbi:MAG: hypothetical protein GY913_33065 [Proteobacteria bacterium]|nr:hypothetical protein [Pseudomonadota bacterium]MCP4921756.1 hypothetical protein [Pseudomonadota bacterium]
MTLLFLFACTGFTINDKDGTTTDTGTSVSSDLDCDAAYDTTAPSGPDCLTGTITCGQTIEGTTLGGSTVMDSDLYESAYCFVPFTDYDGPERAYELQLEADTTAYVTLEAPCGDLGFGLMRWSYEDTCPTGEEHGILDCNGQPSDSTSNTKEAQVWAEKDTRFVLAVDGSAGGGAPFRITVECE